MAKVLKDQDGKEYELVPFKPKDNPQQKDTFLVRPVEKIKPEKIVGLLRVVYEHSERAYVGVTFPSRENAIWIPEGELDLLYDAILSYKVEHEHTTTIS